MIIQVIGPFYLQFPPALTFFYFSFPENHSLVFLLTEILVKCDPSTPSSSPATLPVSPLTSDCPLALTLVPASEE